MANIYIAARFSRRPEANALAQILKMFGHKITSRWVLPDCKHVVPTGLSDQAYDEERRRFAMEDIEDIKGADWCISLMEPPRNDGRGGRHVEFGYALASGCKMTIIGPRETVFHHLDGVEHFNNVPEFFMSLRQVNSLALLAVQQSSSAWKQTHGWHICLVQEVKALT